MGWSRTKRRRSWRCEVPETDEQLLLLPLTRALETLKDRKIQLTVIKPPFAAVGRGALHVVRIREEGDGIVLEATYDDYERLP
jgi:hypothetical protein